MCYLKCENCELKNDKEVFQLHVTVEGINRSHFSVLCEKLSSYYTAVKPIIISYEDSDIHMMTNSHTKTLEKAFEKLDHISSFFQFKKAKVVREKIETVPWTAQKVLYFETHISTTKKLLLDRKKNYSHNINKSTDIYTKRHIDKEQLQSFIDKIKKLDVNCEVMTEAIIYDSNPEYDNHWLERVA